MSPDTTIVVGYNRTSHSENALTWAVAEAVRREAPLRVIYAANYPGMTLPEGRGLLEREPGALDAAREVTAQGLTTVLTKHRYARVTSSTEVTSPTQALTEASTTAAMVVLGSRGYGQVFGTLIGSVGFSVASAAQSPVVVVKGEPGERPLGPDHRIVVGTDGSAAANAAVDAAAAHAVASKTPLEVLTCVGEHPDLSTTALMDSAGHIAAAAARRVRSLHPGLTLTTRVSDTPAAPTLMDASAEAGMVFVGTRGRGAFSSMVLGSVSHAIIHGSRCPVAVIGEGIEW